MHNKIFAYVILNVKSLLKDKIPFVWSILLPLIMYVLNKEQIYEERDLTYWWVYMILCAYIYGVGLYALELKEDGCLRTIFSIDNSPINFFFGNLITQIVFCIISISLFNMVVLWEKKFSFFMITAYSLIVIILCIPYAFLGFGFTLIRKVHANTIRTILSILIFGMFMLLNTTSNLNKYNPMFYISTILTDHSLYNIILYVIVSFNCIVLGSIGILKFNPNSNERR